ncbi:MAG: peptidase caspase catalytic subunit p20 [Candidatus Eremiobacteraeota bacterium]|nr:peptidase caspase catalytic subunit p20 [Candidatus Eremiobacteraeota bacterium]
MRTAVLVGIENYQRPTDMPRLIGCRNDAADMALFLAYLGVAVRRPLLDGDATTEAIVGSLCTEISELRTGDELIFHYSGHGAPFPSNNAVHDAICPFDFDGDPDRVITDERLGTLLDAVPPGARATIIADSCYSGGLQPHMAAAFAVAPVKLAGPRTIPLPALVAAEVARLRRLGLTTNFAQFIAKPNVLVLAACGSDELADELIRGDRGNGVLTYFLLRQLRLSGGLAATAQQTVIALRAELRAEGFAQTPELHGGINPRSTGVIRPIR